MSRSILLRGVSAGALTLILVSTATHAQEALPTIEVGAARSTGNSGSAGSGQGAGSPTPGSAAAILDRNSGDRLTGYSAPNATSATKTDASIMQTPVSVQVVTRQTMDDQQAISIQDAVIGNVSGVYNYFPTVLGFYIRGFYTGAQVYYNGLPLSNTVNFETANVQSIEIMKGPAAVLFGRVEPGGITYVQTKRPLETPYFSVQEQAGSFGNTRTTVDVSGPLTADKTWLYRFNGSFQHSASFIDFVSSTNYLFAPAITYHPTEQFKFYIEGKYSSATQTDTSAGVPAIGNRPAQVPISSYFEDKALTVANPTVYQTRQVYFDWTYDITKDWSLTQRFAYVNAYESLSQSGIGSVDEPTGNIVISNVWDNSLTTSIASNLDLKGKFDTGPLQHSVLFGVDYNNTSTPVAPLVFGGTPLSMNIYNPIYYPSGFSFYDPNNFYYYYGSRSAWRGVYAQDMISAFDDKVHLLIGGRFDWADTINGSGLTHDQAVASMSDRKDSGFSPRVGLVYQPFPWLSLYGNFTQSLGANNGLSTATNVALAPQKGTQYEGGLKFEFFDKRVLATLAYYDIIKTNIPYTDPATLTTRLIGAAESKGVELDISGRVNDNWSLIANFTHDDVRVTKAGYSDPTTEQSTEAPVIGNRLPVVPTNAGNFWAKYDADGALQGLSVAGGVNVIGAAQGDNANSFRLPSHTLVNGMIAYKLPFADGKLTAQLNVSNLFNTTYWQASQNYRTAIYPGPPRTILASLRYEFGGAPVGAGLPSRKGPLGHSESGPALLWTGFYAGANAGYSGVESSSVSGQELTSGTSGFPTGEAWTYSGPTPKGFGGGGQFGYNHQFPDSIVAGIEVDIQAPNLKGNSSGIGTFDGGNSYFPALSSSQSIDWYGTARARLGYAVMPTLLLYGTSGFALGGGTSGFTYVDSRGNFGQSSGSGTHYGWTFGGGFEWAFLPNWSAKVEYLNVDLGQTRGFGQSPSPEFDEIGAVPGFALAHSGVTNRFSTVKAGLNYHFSLFEPSSTVAAKF